MLKIFGITYGNHTTEFIPYKNECKEKPWRFEYNPMFDIIENHISDLSDSDYLGIVSWKFRRKTSMTANQVGLRFRKAQRRDRSTQVYNLSRYLGDHIHFMDWSDEGHKGIKGIIIECCKHTGMNYENDAKHIVYANQFIARKDVYLDYINRIIKPCLELLEGPLWSIVNKDAGYTAGIEKEDLKANTGLDFYNYVPFVLERMMIQYIHNYNIKTVSLI